MVEQPEQILLEILPVAGADLRWLRSVLPAKCGLAGGPISHPSASPYLEEELIVVNAVAKRRAEFRAGRSYARDALAQVGCPRSKILMDCRGAPLWPPGYRGSISHTDEVAIAVAAPHADFRGLGLDVETADPMDKDLEPFIFHPEELRELSRWEGCDVEPSKCMFSAKEAFIKLYYSMENVSLDFLDVRISLDKSPGEYSAYVSDPTVVATSVRDNPARGRLGWNRQTVTAIMYVHS